MEFMTTGAISRWAALLAGSAICMSASDSPKTFSRDVWPILERRCINCHQSGEIAPVALTSYKQVRPWAGAIREAVLSRAMPPWYAAAGSAHSFRNDRSLSKAEIDIIAQW